MNKSHVEIVEHGHWRLIPVSEAVGLNTGARCPSCKQLVKVHKASNNGMRAHFEHHKANPECELGYRSPASKTVR